MKEKAISFMLAAIKQIILLLSRAGAMTQQQARLSGRHLARWFGRGKGIIRHVRAHDLFSKADARRMLLQTTRVLPSLAAVLLLSTLVIYLTIGPGAANQPAREKAEAPAATSAEETPPAARTDLFVPDMAEYNAYSRGQGQHFLDDNTALTDIALPAATPTLAADPTPSPEPTPVPTATPVPLELDEQGTIQEPLSPEAFAPDDSIIYVKAFNANIRSAPGTDAEIIAAVEMADTLKRTGIGLYWSEVQTGAGDVGYIYNELISTDVIYKPAPTPTPRPTSAPRAAATPRPTSAPTQVGSGLTAAQKQEIVDLARSLIGVRYVYGGTSPSGLDCSGLTTYIYKTLFNVNLPRRAKDQASAGKRVSSSQIEIGDIICFDWSSPRGVCDHVGIYIGNGRYIHASYSRRRVVESTVDFSRNPIISIRRIID